MARDAIGKVGVAVGCVMPSCTAAPPLPLAARLSRETFPSRNKCLQQRRLWKFLARSTRDCELESFESLESFPGTAVRLQGRVGVGAPDRNEMLEFSPTRRALASAATSPASGRGKKAALRPGYESVTPENACSASGPAPDSSSRCAGRTWHGVGPAFSHIPAGRRSDRARG